MDSRVKPGNDESEHEREYEVERLAFDIALLNRAMIAGTNGNNSLCGNIQKSTPAWNSPSYSLDPIISIFRDEWFDPVQVIAVKNRVLSAPDERAIDFSNLLTPKLSLL